MKKIMLVINRQSSYKRDIMEHLISKFDQLGYEVHVYQVQEDEIIGIDEIIYVIHNIMEVCNGEIKIELLTNIKMLGIEIANRESIQISNIYISLEEQSSYKDIIITNKEVDIFCEQIEDMIPIALVNPEQVYRDDMNKKGITRELAYPYILDQYRLRMTDYLCKKVAMIDYAYHHLKDNNWVNSVYNEVITSYGMNVEKFINKSAQLYSDETCAGLCQALYIKTKQNKYIMQMIESATKLPVEMAYSIYWTIVRMHFVGKITFSIAEEMRFRKFYEILGERLGRKVEYSRRKCEVNKKRILVMTQQFLGMAHAPTRNVVDYAICLQKQGYEVMIINNGDLVNKNLFPFMDYMVGNYVEAYESIDRYEYKGVTVPFFQTRQALSIVDRVKEVLIRVENFNPQFILNIGGSSLTADVCGAHFEVVSVTTGSGVPRQSKGYFAIPSSPRKESEEISRKLGIQDRTVHVKYSFLRKEIETRYTREQFGINEKAFVIVLVGNRLDDEIDDILLETMDEVANNIDEVCFILVGGYNKYEVVLQKYPSLKRHSKNIGYIGDIQGIYTICDAYLNPKRSGGATSAAEAMDSGVPVMTKAYGDVYYQLWLENSFEDNQAIIEYITRLTRDKDFYQAEGSRSKEHIKDFFDTKQMMHTIIRCMEDKKNI